MELDCWQSGACALRWVLMVEPWDEWGCCHLQAQFWRQGAHLYVIRKFCRAKPKRDLA